MTDLSSSNRPELEQARETIRRLNRRVQSAEAGLAEKVNANAGQSFGRILANSAATMYAAQIEDLKAELSRLQSENERLKETAITPEEWEAIDGSGSLVDFAYEHGFHEEGFPRPDILQSLADRMRHICAPLLSKKYAARFTGEESGE